MTRFTRSKSDPTLTNAVIGDGVLLDRTPNGDAVIHRVGDHGIEEVGRFNRIASAWAAIDELDVS